MDLLQKLDRMLLDTTVVADVATNTAKGKIDVIGGKCPKGQVYDKIRKVCVPTNDEGFVYVLNKRKNKQMRISDDPKIIKKYKSMGYEIVETSVVGGSYVSGTTTNMIGSGQTRIWGVKRGLMLDLNRKEPVEVEMDNPTDKNLGRKALRFNKLTGAYIPSQISD